MLFASPPRKGASTNRRTPAEGVTTMLAPVPPLISRPTAKDKQSFRTADRRKLPKHQSPDLFQWAGVFTPRRDIASPFDPRKAVKFALGIWHTAMPAHHAILAERWATSQNLILPDDISDCIRFHPNLKFGNDRAPGLVFLLRDLNTDEPTGVLRIYLSDDGNVIGRRTLGRAFNTAVKLDADDQVTDGLHIASTVERAVAAMNAGLRPIWFVNSLTDFPLIPAIEALTIITTPDDTAALAVAARFQGAGREVFIVSNEPPPRDIQPSGGDP